MMPGSAILDAHVANNIEKKRESVWNRCSVEDPRRGFISTGLLHCLFIIFAGNNFISIETGRT
jgi:hypothetical protein